MIADSNIIIDLLHGEGEQAEKVQQTFVSCALRGQMYVNPVIFAESASGSPSLADFETRLRQIGLENMPLSNEDAYRASLAFRAYRQNGGPRTTILPDFLIGAQASIRGWPILTRDPKRFSTYFPEVELIDPRKADHD
jgi:predicted nucleic acid-binding protein